MSMWNFHIPMHIKLILFFIFEEKLKRRAILIGIYELLNGRSYNLAFS